MKSYFLDDYHLTCAQTGYSCFLPEYGLQHLQIAWKERDIIHGTIALFELIPLIGLLVSIFEKFLASQYHPFDPSAIPASFVRYTVIKEGSQEGCLGSVEVEKAKRICQELNKKNTNGVYFSESKIPDQISGGTCSSMAFDFANRYLEMRKNASPEEIFEKIGSDYSQSSQDFRTTQAAFNAIGMAPGADPPKDYNRAKIDAMLRFYNRRVIAASDEIDIQNNGAIAKMKKVLREFKEGVFIFRILMPGDNEKGEIQGHSTVLIRNGNQMFFYEPCSGIIQIDEGYESTSLSRFLFYFNQSWHTNLARLYQIA